MILLGLVSLESLTTQEASASESETLIEILLENTKQEEKENSIVEARPFILALHWLQGCISESKPGKT